MLDLTPYRSGLDAFTHRWRVRELALFGSAVREDFGPASDVDVLVAFEDDARWSLFDLVEMKAELESLFGRRVDLAERRAVEASPNALRRVAILRAARPVTSDAS